MRKIAKDPFSLVQAVSANILVSVMLLLLLLFPWQFFYSVDAQDDEGEKEDIETAGTNNINDDNSFPVIIPENAAWEPKHRSNV